MTSNFTNEIAERISQELNLPSKNITLAKEFIHRGKISKNIEEFHKICSEYGKFNKVREIDRWRGGIDGGEG